MNTKNKKNNSIFFKILNFSIILFSLFSFFNTTNAYSQVDSVKSAISKDYNIIKYFAEEANVRNPKDYAAINEYMQIIAYFETRINNDTKNSCYKNGVNTAKGYFQFLNGTYWWIYDEIHEIMPDFPEGRYIYEYSYAGQAQFSITLWNKMSKRNVVKELYERNYDSGLEIYCKYHHTDCDSQLSPKRYKELKDALHNWEKDLYHMTPEKWERLRKEEEERLRKLKKKLKKSIKKIKRKIEDLIEKREKEQEEKRKEEERENKKTEKSRPKEKSKPKEKSRPKSQAPINTNGN